MLAYMISYTRGDGWRDDVCRSFYLFDDLRWEITWEFLFDGMIYICAGDVPL